MKKNSRFAQGLFFIALIIMCRNTLICSAAEVIPSGKTIGIKMYSEGLIVTGITDFTSADGTSISPAKDAGIAMGDVILSANGEKITSCEQFEKKIDGSELSLRVKSGDSEKKVAVSPSADSDGVYRIGMWVRDSTAGIGTLTCFEPSTMKYSALGHSITDIDTGNIMTAASGNIQECTILSLRHGYIGSPGYVTADFDGADMGTIENNSEYGISGTLCNAPTIGDTVSTASFDEISDGPALLLTDICSADVTAYNVSIEKLSESDTKSMVVEITDEQLLDATGGIIQGMSGAPIMQNGRLIGAVTHVFVNNPKKGYAISADKLAF